MNTAKIHVAFLLLLVIGVTVGGAARDPVAPKQPGPITAVAANETSISATWASSRDNVGVIGYDVYLQGDAIGTVASPGVSVGSLRCGTAYELSVNAFDAAGNRSESSRGTISTAACPQDTTPPNTPTGFAASSITQTSAHLAWNAASDNVGVVGYEVFKNAAKVADTPGQSNDPTGLACGTTYSFAVDAYDAAGNRSQRATVNVATAACTSSPPPPPPPSGPPTVTSSIKDGDTVQRGATWTVEVTPTPQKVEFWADGTKLSEDAAAPYQQAVGLAAGGHSLGVCSWVNGARYCDSRVSSGVIARITVVDTASSPPPPPPSAPSGSNVANVWVDGNGGSCQRAGTAGGYADASACGGLAAAQAAAQPGDVVRVKGGSYGNQTLTQDKGSPAITFRPADGETPSFGTVTFQPGAGWATLERLTMDTFWVGPADSGAPAHDLVFRDIDANVFYVNLAARVSILGGDFGPSHHRKPTIAVYNPWDGYAPTDILVDGARFHDVTMDPGGEHVECLLIYAGDRVTVRNNTFSNCEGTGDVGVLFLRGSGTPPRLANITVAGNTFSSQGNPQVDPTAAWFNVQVDTCIPGISIHDNTAPKGIYWISC